MADLSTGSAFVAGTTIVASAMNTRFTNIETWAKGTPDLSTSGSMTTVKGTLNVDEAVTFDATLGVTGTATLAGIVDITNTTDASDATGDTGALRTEGGASIAKKLFVGTDLDVDGTTNLDAVDIDGAVQIDNTVTVGANGTGYDVKFYGATADAYMEWDESADDLILHGAAGLIVNGTTTCKDYIWVNSDDSDANIYFGDQDGGNTRLRFDDSEEYLFIDIDNVAVVSFDTTVGVTINQGVIDVGTGDDLEIQAITGKVLKNSSSIRYKNVADVNMADHLTASMVDSLEPKMFSYKNDSDNHPMIGFIAEEVDAISPFLAYHAGEQAESLDKTALIALLAIGLKDARTRIAALEA